MTFEDDSMSGLWTPPLRRDARVAAAPLPSAAPIGHAATKPPAVHRGRLIAGFAAVVVIGLSATTASILTSGAGIAGATATVAADASDRTEAALSGGERGGPHDTGRVGAGQADAEDRTDADGQSDAEEGTDAEDGVIDAPPVSEVDAQTPDADVDIVSPGTGTTEPDAPTPPDSGTAHPAPSTPPAQDPPAQEPPAAEPAPAPPAPHPSPSPSPSSPPATPPPATPKPLAFTGLTENRVTLLGIPLLSSYTLSLSGEPGSRASVTYGLLSAGSVTFDGNGRATLKIGGSLLGITLSNPIIRAKYTDGTAGAAVEARRDSI